MILVYGGGKNCSQYKSTLVSSVFCSGPRVAPLLIVCVVFCLFSSCILCVQCLWIVHLDLPLFYLKHQLYRCDCNDRWNRKFSIKWKSWKMLSKCWDAYGTDVFTTLTMFIHTLWIEQRRVDHLVSSGYAPSRLFWFDCPLIISLVTIYVFTFWILTFSSVTCI